MAQAPSFRIICNFQSFYFVVLSYVRDVYRLTNIPRLEKGVSLETSIRATSFRILPPPSINSRLSRQFPLTMLITSMPTLRCLRALMALGHSTAPSASAIGSLQEACLRAKTTAIPPLRLPQAEARYYYSSKPKEASQTMGKKGSDDGRYITPRAKKSRDRFENGRKERSSLKRQGEQNKTKADFRPKSRGSRPGKGDSRTLRVNTRLWEVEGSLTLPYDRQTLYGVAERVSHWVKWFPGCNDVKVLETKSISDQSGETRTVPQTTKIVFGERSLSPNVHLHVQLQPARLVSLVYKPANHTVKNTEQYEISWSFTDQHDSSGTEATAPVGTHVRFHFRVRSVPHVISNCEATWGKGFDEEESENIIKRLGERAAYLLQTEGSAPNALPPGLDLEVENERMLVRRLPARDLTMRERGNRLIRRVQADGADEDEQRRLHQRFASRDYRSTP
ncbi:hypothetical protein VMCG_09362 [Cytospora schulzeri]|uniref:Uncharacterized protein n=1 Tax=Cytospora schulzeri TaxID=448051 RepID=A0A423VJN9_9PEZI|nr:hypothetical protein VMCG_09362 [Valsa malicola]